ncbi:hypothetical protein GGR57DRAFT_517348 [Xylariaceae sp. FL1272]|nr:hypothetical protein GGR57DRAFT_517348 [Xylariaceae sp. FL1272]
MSMGLNIYQPSYGGPREQMSSVAAKARSASQLSSGRVKTNIRMRPRLAVSTDVPEESHVKRASVFSPGSETQPGSTMSPVQFMPMPGTLQPLEVDTDMSSHRSTDGIARISSVDKLESIVDVSNHVELSPSPSHEALSTVSTTSTSSTSPDTRRLCESDSYGWESEYVRRKPSSIMATAICSYHTSSFHTYRVNTERLLPPPRSVQPRTSRDNRSLLRSVFHAPERKHSG